MLLIVTNKTDLTADYLILELERLKIPFLRLNTEDYLSKYQINFKLTNNSIQSIINYYDGTTINNNDITGVFFKHAIIPIINNEIPSDQLEFAKREVIEVLKSLWRTIDNKLWLNHPKNLFLANNKIDQLKKASEMGFSIPDTCVSSDPEEIKNFYYSSEKNIIAKAVKHGFYHTSNRVQIASTKKVDKNFIQNIDQYANIPTIFQKRIDKMYDLRVTVIGDNVYTAAIHSQDYNETKTDWRVYELYEDIDLEHTKFKLPSKISKLCQKITKGYNLGFSAIDLIYTPENEYYFLELNPNGQWVWIEEKLGFPIRSSIINYLGY